MKHGPRRFVATLGASAIALCASVALTSPALANTVTYGDLQFTSSGDSTIYEADGSQIPEGATVVSGEADQVTIYGGDAGVDVTQVEVAEGETTVAELNIGETENPYAGTIELTGLRSELNIKIYGDTSNQTPGLTVVLNDCVIDGAASGEAAIDVMAEANPTLRIVGSIIGGGDGVPGDETRNGGPGISVANTASIELVDDVVITGGKGASGSNPGDGGTGINMAIGEGTIKPNQSTVLVTGGTGGDASQETGQCGMGGYGIYAPLATLEMNDNSVLTAVAGEDGEVGVAVPTSVGLTVQRLALSNGTGVNGTGPEITAIGHPQENALDLYVGAIEAGSLADNTFYPWLLQASTSDGPENTLGDNAWVVDFAGSGFTGEDQFVPRQGWRVFNIAPHEVTGLEATLWTNTEDDTDIVWNVVNPMDGYPTPRFAFGVKPVFDVDVDVNPYEAINEATISNLTYPVGSLNESGSMDLPDYSWLGTAYTVNPSYKGTDLKVTGTAKLPETFASLYPDIDTNLDTTFPLYGAKAVYRLNNEYTPQHLYTTDVTEVNSLNGDGWILESVAWYAPSEGWTGEGGTTTTIERLWNPYTGDHYYVPSTDTTEIDGLLDLGWKKDSAAANIYSLPEAAAIKGYPLSMPVFTLFNPYEQIGTHFYTADLDEALELTQDAGWEWNTTIIHGYLSTLIDPATPED